MVSGEAVRRLALLFWAITLCGCGGLGQMSIQKDRFDYSTAIADSWKQMMLLNIVKLRYGDTPIFLEVGSVVSQYKLESEINAEAQLFSGDILDNGLLLGGSGTYSTRPTITYTPLTGEKFTKSLLSPIPPSAIFRLIQSGWSSELVLRVCVSAINDNFNISNRRVKPGAVNSGFDQLVDALVFIQENGGLGARIVSQGKGEESILFFRRNLGSELEDKFTELADILQLDVERSEFQLVYGTTAANGAEIAVLTRSMLDIISELAYTVRIPQVHLDEKRAMMSPQDREGRLRVLIESSDSEPSDPFIAVQYRDHWFYIKDTDIPSKRVFSFLMFFFTLAESGTEGLGPVLTLPAGSG